jgi:hypothetical protein
LTPRFILEIEGGRMPASGGVLNAAMTGVLAIADEVVE